MMKKITTILGTITLVCFSFYYTDSAIDLIRKTDPIMQQIIDFSDEYGNTSIDSTLVNNNIIPGIKGVAVNVEKSYNNMKRLGKFDKSLIVFEEVYPTNTVNENYDYYVISGNLSKNNVSLLFPIQDGSYVEEILSILSKKNVQATFFTSREIFDNSLDLVKLILNSGQKVELLENEYDSVVVKKYRTIKKMVSGESLSFCYTTTKNTALLENCKKEKMYTIIPSIVSSNYPYNDVKSELKNGSIISLENNKNTVRELPSIINYIFQKGKKIVPLEKLLEE